MSLTTNNKTKTTNHDPDGDPPRLQVEASVIGLRNRCLMHFLERIASTFNEAGIPLMVLKGAALNLTIYETPGERPMLDLDLMIRPEHVEDTSALLQRLGCRRGEDLVREDFFPRFYYETEYISETVYPMRIDLHVRPFRPLRYSRMVPEHALWRRAEPINIGQATVLIPAVEEMLIHLMVHAAIHGFSEAKWLEDIQRWIERYASRRPDRKASSTIDWDRFVSTVAAWGLALPVREAIAQLDRRSDHLCPKKATARLAKLPVSWRDRLALWHAPRDAADSAGHVFVNVLTTPGLGFVFGYLRAVVLPDRKHMGEWYRHRHWGWLSGAYLLRWLRPVVRLPSRLWRQLYQNRNAESLAAN